MPTLGWPTRPNHSRRATTARRPLDLDSVYGAGPWPSRSSTTRPTASSSRSKAAACSRTCPRRADGTAIVGDPRNDENLIIAGMHCAFAAFHNRVVDLVRGEGLGDAADVFERRAG